MTSSPRFAGLRSVTFFGICTSIVALLLGCSETGQIPSIDTLAQAKFTEQAYVMEYKGTPVGTHITEGGVNEENQLVYTHEFTLTSMRNTTFTARQTLSFSASAPHLLDHAKIEKFASNRSSAYEARNIQRNELGLSAEGWDFLSSNLPHEYTLHHYLGIEKWLLGEEIALGDQLSLLTIKLDQQESVVVEWTAVHLTSSSVLIRSSQGIESEYDTSRSIPQLKISRHPSGLTLRYVDNLSQVDTPAISKLGRQATTVPVSGTLPRPTELSLLELSVTFAQGDPGPWRDLLTPSGTLLVDHTTTNESHDVARLYDDLPADGRSTSEEIRRLSMSITNGITSEDEKLNAMVKFIHDYVSYNKSDTPQSVTSTLRSKTGDCSDIADLLSALAEASGLQSRTVYGLAYDKSSKSFGIHAWNQVRLQDNRLRSVDPTWNQTYVDATHIEFPDAYAHEVLGSLAQMKFSVVRYEHIDPQI